MQAAVCKSVLTMITALLIAGCANRDTDAPTGSTGHASWLSHRGSSKHHGFKSASADPFAGKGSPYYKGSNIPFGGGRSMVGKPYQVAGRWFTPHEQPGYDKTGVASWYGEDFHRRMTSNGEYFDMNTLTAAHATLPLPSYAQVTNLQNGKQVVVRVNDRGPFVNTRIIDLSKRAADELGYRMKGKTQVRVRLIGPAPAHDSMAHMLAMNNALHEGASMGQLVAMSNDAGGRVAVKAPQMAQARPRKIGSQISAQQVAEASPSLAQSTNYVIRAGVFHDLANAKEAYRQLATFGPTRIVKGVGVNGPLFRVEIGPLDNRADAQAALTTAQGAGFEGAKLITNDNAVASAN